MANIPTIEPEKITAGDTVKWAKSLSDYSASDGWTLTYYIRGAASLDKAATADGDDYAVTVTAAETGALTAGAYSWTARVSKSGEVYTVGSGSFEVLADPAGIVEGFDPRSTVKKMLDNIETAILNLTSKKYSSWTVDGKSYTLKNLDELMNTRERLSREYAAELRNERVKKGLASGRQHRVRFGR